MKEKTAVIGGGAWGTALASLMAESGRPVEIYAIEDDVVTAINSSHENKVFLPGIILNDSVKAKQMDALNKCDTGHIVWTVPTQFSRATARRYKDALSGRNILNASKGIEIETGKLVISTLKDEIDAEFSILSGPSFASVVAQKKPTAVSLGSRNIEIANWWQNQICTDYFRIYTSTDIIGLEVGGALKNVIAVATGISDGLNMDHNARAVLITRGLAEITRFGVAYGAKHETFTGLSGLGDLVLTATGDNSRNRQAGLSLAKGATLEEITGKQKSVAEGIFTAKAVHIASQKINISMPICTEVYKIVYEGKKASQSVWDLMHRPLTTE
ncbi:MAG: NAD(P)-dependent glycerol-3-phosphate dehydrogenase [Deferribacteraceae bacterium]|jgi:glycerol-3-phosphate dehydrogenase (NAD(P)+)|nr:NAD(P)-dependent glycerol-3-phosphate dehydrogenase [Deferribacteraceae bacterium]